MMDGPRFLSVVITQCFCSVLRILSCWIIRGGMLYWCLWESDLSKSDWTDRSNWSIAVSTGSEAGSGSQSVFLTYSLGYCRHELFWFLKVRRMRTSQV